MFVERIALKAGARRRKCRPPYIPNPLGFDRLGLMRLQKESERTLVHTRERTDALFRIVDPDAIYERPIPERHRIIFYLGHLEAFDWNLIGRYALDQQSFHP